MNHARCPADRHGPHSAESLAVRRFAWTVASTHLGRWANIEWLTWRVAWYGLVLSVLLLAPTRLLAQSHTDNFDGPEPSWRLIVSAGETDAERHVRRPNGYQGSHESVRVIAQREGAPFRMELPVPPSRPLDELEAGLWVRSNHRGLRLCLRLVFVGVNDPATGGPLRATVRGEEYRDIGRWQELHCRTSDRAVNEVLRAVRARFKGQSDASPINASQIVVDRVFVTAEELPVGITEIGVDELTYGPIVRPEVVPVDNEEFTQVPKAVGSGIATGDERLLVEFQLDRLRVDRRPLVPRMIPYHREQPEAIAETGVNIAWIPDLHDNRLISRLRQQRVWTAATPPHPRGSEGQTLQPTAASLIPFNTSTSSIVMWMMGARVNPSVEPSFFSWIDQVRDADQQYRRPIAADVVDDERAFSRQLSMLGLSRHVLNSTLTLRDHRDWLEAHRASARPGAFTFTWLQAEPPASLTTLPAFADVPVRDRGDLQVGPVIEPEQYRLQVYSALAAGCRGLGYWTTTPLDDNSALARERRFALTQLNLELWLIEPWLAASNAESPATVTIKSPAKTPTQHGPTGFGINGPSQTEREAIARARESASQAERRLQQELSAAVLRADGGVFLIPTWFDEFGQFVPGQMAANNAVVQAPPGHAAAAAWEISTTAVHSLDSKPAAGGRMVMLPRLDQTAIILVTSDENLVRQLRERMEQTREPSARASVELANLKLERTRHVDQQLWERGIAQPDGPQQLARATTLLSDARTAVQRKDWHQARERANEVMQLTRILQRAHWEQLTARCASPVSSPYAVCFNTLPAHVDLLRRLNRGPDGEGASSGTNLIKGGDFESASLVATGWKHSQETSDNVRASAELFPSGYNSRYCLRLLAYREGPENAAPVARPPVTVSSPPIPVTAGQIVTITGQIQLPNGVGNNIDGFMIYDSLLGRDAAIRWRKKQDWQRFELIREVREDQDLVVHFELHGLGEVQIDNFRVLTSTPNLLQTVSGQTTSSPIRRDSSATGPSSRIPGTRPRAPTPPRYNIGR